MDAKPQIERRYINYSSSWMQNFTATNREQRNRERRLLILHSPMSGKTIPEIRQRTLTKNSSSTNRNLSPRKVSCASTEIMPSKIDNYGDAKNGTFHHPERELRLHKNFARFSCKAITILGL